LLPHCIAQAPHEARTFMSIVSNSITCANADKGVAAKAHSVANADFETSWKMSVAVKFDRRCPLPSSISAVVD
jgi:hypothetical protein